MLSPNGVWECEVHNDLHLTLCCLFSVCTLHPVTVHVFDFSTSHRCTNAFALAQGRLQNSARSQNLPSFLFYFCFFSRFPLSVSSLGFLSWCLSSFSLVFFSLVFSWFSLGVLFVFLLFSFVFPVFSFVFLFVFLLCFFLLLFFFLFFSRFFFFLFFLFYNVFSCFILFYIVFSCFLLLFR